MLTLSEVVELTNESSDRHRHEPKSWLKFEDVVHCRDVESLNAFVQQYLTERGLVGESRTKCYWALFYEWKKGISSGC